MTDRIAALEALAEKVKAGNIPDAHEVTAAFRGWYRGEEPIVPYVRMSCDARDIRAVGAAKALHQAVLPEWCWSVDRMGQAMVWFPWVEGDAITYEAGEGGMFWDDPARSLLLAILRALIDEAKEAE